MNTYSEILKQIMSDESAEIIIEPIDTLRDSMYKMNSDVKDLPQSEIWNLIMKKFADVKNNQAEWLTELKDAIKKMRKLRLEVAVRLDEESHQEIWGWVKRNVGEDVVTQMQINPALMAGARIIWEGKYYEKRV